MYSRCIVNKVISPCESSNRSRLLLVFGSGPIIDPRTGLKPSVASTRPGDEDLTIWSKSLALSASLLFELGVIDRVLVMGGRTGGEVYAPEAELIGRRMEVHGVPSNSITLERESLDTVENIINALNIIDREEYPNRSLFFSLCTSFHLSRVRVILVLFGITLTASFSSEEMLRYFARTVLSDVGPTRRSLSMESAIWDNDLLQTIQQQLDVNELSTYFERQRGENGRGYKDRVVMNDLLLRELLEFPEKLVCQLWRIQSDQRLRAVLDNVDDKYPGLLSGHFGISSTTRIDRIRKQLQQSTWSGLSSETLLRWVRELETGTP